MWSRSKHTAKVVPQEASLPVEDTRGPGELLVRPGLCISAHPNRRRCRVAWAKPARVVAHDHRSGKTIQRARRRDFRGAGPDLSLSFSEERGRDAPLLRQPGADRNTRRGRKHSGTSETMTRNPAGADVARERCRAPRDQSTGPSPRPCRHERHQAKTSHPVPTTKNQLAPSRPPGNRQAVGPFGHRRGVWSDKSPNPLEGFFHRDFGVIGAKLADGPPLRAGQAGRWRTSESGRSW